jgi:hypothetical protein
MISVHDTLLEGGKVKKYDRILSKDYLTQKLCEMMRKSAES